MKNKYSSVEIRKLDCNYNIVIGRRSNGKTYDALYNALREYWESGCKTQFAVLRRWDEDFTKQRGASMFNSLICNGDGDNVIEDITGGEWNSVYYYSRRWFLAKFDMDLNKRVTMEEPFAFAFALSQMEHDKSTSYPNVKTIIFDEFISRDTYLRDEFVLFINTVSTIARERTDVKIWLLGNTVNQYCPYFEEMGLNRVRTQKQGTIDVYTIGETDGNHIRIAVEYCKDSERKNKSEKGDVNLFAFDNSRLKMVTNGAWEMLVYPHCPVPYTSKEIVFNFFVEFKSDVLHCEVIKHDDLLFIFVHKKTTPFKDITRDLIYTTEYNPRPNYRRRLTTPSTELERKIYNLFLIDKVFYADNVTGEIMRNYLLWCKSSN